MASIFRKISNLFFITDGTSTVGITDVAGKKSLNVNVTDITIDAVNDSIEVRNKPMSLLIDKVSTSGITYIGEAIPGTTQSATSWRIFILDKTTTTTQKKWASNGDFSNAWTNRTSLTYT